jgi:transposase
VGRICPRNDESAGKTSIQSACARVRLAQNHIDACSWAAKKDSYVQAQFYRIKARRGPKKAIMVVAATKTSAAITSIAVPLISKGSAWSNVWPT